MATTPPQSGPYPSGPVKVLGFSYKDDIHLTRKMVKVQTRRGRDANYLVSQDYHATVKIRQHGKISPFPICVPKDYETDLASVPRWGRWLVSRVGPHLEASVIHDWLFEAWHLCTPPLKPTEDIRRFADDVFLAAMVEAKVSGWQRRLMLAAVRTCFGKRTFYTP